MLEERSGEPLRDHSGGMDARGLGRELRPGQMAAVSYCRQFHGVWVTPAEPQSLQGSG